MILVEATRERIFAEWTSAGEGKKCKCGVDCCVSNAYDCPRMNTRFTEEDAP